MPKTDTPEKPSGLALLRAPFPPHQISKLPKPIAKDAKKGRCAECGGWHGLPAVHLDYVGHAALTDRLLDADPMWSWEPVADPAALGLPTTPGGMWIRLTVCGVTRWGFGIADAAAQKSLGDTIKETIGDALRNAAMRFGAALELWHRGNLHASDDETEPATATREPDGYGDWRGEFESIAALGSKALAAAWRASDETYRQHYSATVSEPERDALRERARVADAVAAAKAVPS